MNDVAAKVREETQRFHAALPQLLKTLSGRWVVFKDGEVRGDFASQKDAFEAGLRMFGPRGGHVIAKVEEIVPIPITAGVLYGMT